MRKLVRGRLASYTRSRAVPRTSVHSRRCSGGGGTTSRSTTGGRPEGLGIPGRGSASATASKNAAGGHTTISDGRLPLRGDSLETLRCEDDVKCDIVMYCRNTQPVSVPVECQAPLASIDGNEHGIRSKMPAVGQLVVQRGTQQQYNVCMPRERLKLRHRA